MRFHSHAVRRAPVPWRELFATIQESARHADFRVNLAARAISVARPEWLAVGRVRAWRAAARGRRVVVETAAMIQQTSAAPASVSPVAACRSPVVREVRAAL